VAGIVALDRLEPKFDVKLPSSSSEEFARVKLLSLGCAVEEFRNPLAILTDTIMPNKAKTNKIFINLYY
jgi:hypothetical protein